LLGYINYGGRPRFNRKDKEQLRVEIRGFNRQPLHPRRLSLEHPASGDEISWEVDIPADMQAMISILRDDAQGDE
jgi:23S rRNA pseudouridine1911/1915/1917 synthase